MARKMSVHIVFDATSCQVFWPVWVVDAEFAGVEGEVDNDENDGRKVPIPLGHR